MRKFKILPLLLLLLTLATSAAAQKKTQITSTQATFILVYNLFLMRVRRSVTTKFG